MAAAVLGYFGLRRDSGHEAQTIKEDVPRNTTRALPANWYTSAELYQLERRAIFSRQWQLITHKVRLSKPGDWLKFEVAGFEFVLAHDRQGTINGFHNICRHRAFPVVTGAEGNAKIFSCKYHGWSYGLNGKLAKAPGYQDLPDFDKSKNSLLPIHVHVDCNNFIWVNLDAAETPEISWDDAFSGIDRQERYAEFNFGDYVFDHTWQMDGPCNWKIMADNYNECYHCAGTHPDIGAVANLESYSVKTHDGRIIHNPATTDEQRAAGLTVASTYYFPNVSTNITPHFFMIQRFIPQTPTTATMHYQVFRNTHSSPEQFSLVNDIYKRVMSEDKELCKLAQRNINAGVFVNGEMHPKMEKGPLHFQHLVRQAVGDWRERERRDGKGEIWPARQVVGGVGAGVSREDVEFCSGLACEKPERLEW